jgi:FixJ family two-component response regulator
MEFHDCREAVSDCPHRSSYLSRVQDPAQLAKTTKIALIDDDELVSEAIESLIRALGYDVNAFSSAESYLRSGTIRDTSCVITDLQMPGMTGVELQNWLIANGYHIPVIFVSGLSDGTVRATVMRAGAVAFLSKPINAACLAECLGKALKG